MESLFRSDSYRLLEDAIRAELAAELIEAKVDIVAHLITEGDGNLDAIGKFNAAAKLQIALDVLNVYADPNTEKFKTEVHI